MSYGQPPPNQPPPNQPPPNQPPPNQPPGGYGPPSAGPGSFPNAAGGTEPPNDFLVPAILSMFCCFPFAIPAILSAAKVNALWNLGDYAGAQDRAAKAKRFTIIAVIVGVIWYLLSTVGYFGIIASIVSNAPASAY
ncbi:CD225/dispanin family protein [Streptomonospora salina]|uniref:Interferon-induced transmembrane protein n=1 Tax=Streptomonospora salina TaxID=104205 RepID=A0A841E826_9ACTN|nr:CD225/dispanin family protein [Streptomonospora salina]MBB5996700.1 hypothetical protein [Streptomonospora salina]